MLSDAALAALKKATGQDFVFFPPIRGLEENRWRFNEATRIEFSATHTPTGETIWFPRSNVSYVTVEDHGLTIALKREMRYSGGAVWAAPGVDADKVADAPQQDSALAENPESDEDPEIAESPSPVLRGPVPRRSKGLFSEPLPLVLGTVAVITVVVVMGLIAARAWLHPEARTVSAPITDSNLYTLTGEDTYADVVRKVGKPEGEQGLSSAGNQIQQRALIYTRRNYAVILMSVEGPGYGQEPKYIGAVNLSDGAVVASVETSHNSDTSGLLKLAARQLQR